MRLEFDDGARIEQDSRREDPLIYFVPPAGWGGAVGFLALPEYEEHTAWSITLQVHTPHEARLAALGDAELRVLVGRLAAALRTLFRHWTEVRLDWPAWLIDRLGGGTVVDLFQAAGWQPRPAGAESPLVFVR